MKSVYLLAGASLLRSARAIPAYITTVFSCPDVVTITQTVYPPGWTSTGPIYTTRALTEPQPEKNPAPQDTCTETGLSTSWETEYATRTVYYSEYGMYSGPPGCPSTIIAYMPTTVTCSEPQTTGWVGYSADLACASCTATTLVGMRPSVSGSETYYTVWTEVYVEAGATTQASQVGSQWTTSGSAPPYAAPYAKQCTSTAYGGGGGGYNTYTYTGAGAQPTYTYSKGAYPSIDYNDPNVFRGGESVPIQSAGYTSAAGQPSPATYSQASYTYTYTNAQGPYTWSTGGGYPSINYDDPDVFKGGPGTGASTQAPPQETGTYRATQETGTYRATQEGGAPTTTAAGTSRAVSTDRTGRVSSYPADYNDPNVFLPISGTIEIVSATGPPPTQAPTATYTVATNYGSNYASIDANASENFRPISGTIEIVSLTPPQTFADPITTSIPVSTRVTSNYPSINYADPSVFAAVDPNASLGGGAAPSATSTASA